MKYLIAVADGCADLPGQPVGTPLSYAHTPCLDRLAARSQIGQTCLIPPGCDPGSQAALLTLLGAPAASCRGGRAALEALAQDIDLSGRAVLRCNLVSLEGNRLVSHDGGGLTQDEADHLLHALGQALGDPDHTFLSAMGYRALLVRRGPVHPGAPAPDGLLGQDITPYLPADADLRRLFFAAREILEAHPVNAARRASGQLPANGIWLWGGGALPALPNLTARTGLAGGATGGVPLVQGITRGLGLTWLKVPHADGTLYTNWEGKAFAAFDALVRGGLDFVFVHAEAPDEAGHAGSLPEKVAAIEYFDQRLLAPLTGWLDETGTNYRLLVLPDHPTPLSLRSHTADPVPWLLYDSRTILPGGIYDELHTADAPFVPGDAMLDLLLERRPLP